MIQGRGKSRSKSGKQERFILKERHVKTIIFNFHLLYPRFSWKGVGKAKRDSKKTMRSANRPTSQARTCHALLIFLQTKMEKIFPPAKVFGVKLVISGLILTLKWLVLQVKQLGQSCLSLTGSDPLDLELNPGIPDHQKTDQAKKLPNYPFPEADVGEKL